MAKKPPSMKKWKICINLRYAKYHEKTTRGWGGHWERATYPKLFDSYEDAQTFLSAQPHRLPSDGPAFFVSPKGKRSKNFKKSRIKSWSIEPVYVRQPDVKKYNAIWL